MISILFSLRQFLHAFDNTHLWKESKHERNCDSHRRLKNFPSWLNRKKNCKLWWISTIDSFESLLKSSFSGDSTLKSRTSPWKIKPLLLSKRLVMIILKFSKIYLLRLLFLFSAKIDQFEDWWKYFFYDSSFHAWQKNYSKFYQPFDTIIYIVSLSYYEQKKKNQKWVEKIFFHAISSKVIYWVFFTEFWEAQKSYIWIICCAFGAMLWTLNESFML